MFDVVINGEVESFVHPEKTVAAWRRDMRSAIGVAAEDIRKDPEAVVDDLHNGLRAELRKRGYLEIHDVISDVYEGRITCRVGEIVDDPSHDVQKDGFGHYGFEAKQA